MASKTKLECMECGKKFSRSTKTLETRDVDCPKCGGGDIELAIVVLDCFGFDAHEVAPDKDGF